MTALRPWRAGGPRLLALLCVPLLAACSAPAPEAPEPTAAGWREAVAAGPMAPDAPTPETSYAGPQIPRPSTAPATAAPDVPVPPRSPSSSTGAAPDPDEAHEPRRPPRRPGPTQGVPPQRPTGGGKPGKPGKPATPARPAPAAPRPEPLPANACDGLARYGIFPPSGTTHEWCLAQQRVP